MSRAQAGSASGSRVTRSLRRRKKGNRIQSMSNLSSSHLPIWPHSHTSDRYQAAEGGDRLSQSGTNEISSRTAVISVAVVDEHSFTRDAISRSLKETCKNFTIVSFATSDQCLESTKNYDTILYHGYGIIEDQSNIDIKLANIKKLSSLAPVILLCDVEHYDVLRAAFECGVRGYIPTTSTTLEVAIEIIHLVKAGGIFVPPSSLSSRRVELPTTHNPITTTQKLTPRQMAVLDHLKQGHTNKVIAFELNMSGSSVKTHIQNIMKKMNARNRTEVVCLSHKLERTKT